MNDCAYWTLSPAQRIVAYLLAKGATIAHQPGGVLHVEPPPDKMMNMVAVLEALAAHNQEILALIPEVKA